MRRIALAVRDRVRELVPDAIEEVDASAGLLGFTFRPGTYKGLFAAVAPQRSYVNLMFARGVELLPADAAGLLRGTGKKARHVRFDDPSDVESPGVAALIREAANRTPRS